MGFTSQFEGLEKVHQQYKDKGFSGIRFFHLMIFFSRRKTMKKDIAKVCFINYGVTFTMFTTSEVRGSDANPIFKTLKRTNQLT